MRIDTILKIWCPGCESINFVNQGDITRLSGGDPDGFECWCCHRRELYDPEETEHYEWGGPEDSEHATFAEYVAERCSFDEGKKEA